MEDKRRANKTKRLRFSSMDDQTSIYQNLRAWILQLPGVKEAPHRVGGVEFQVGNVEFMHSHGPSWLDIRLSKEQQSSVLKAGLALSHKAEVHAQAGWVSLQIESSQDLVRARKIIQLAYENATKSLEEVKSGRMQSRLG